MMWNGQMMPLYRLIHFAGFRLFEIVMSVTMIVMGAWVVIWPNSVGDSSFRAILDVTSIDMLAVIYTTIGVSRMLALYVNGSSFFWGPLVRAVSALGSACVLFQMDFSLIRLHFDTGREPSVGIPLFTSLVLGELISIYRAMADVRTHT